MFSKKKNENFQVTRSANKCLDIKIKNLILNERMQCGIDTKLDDTREDKTAR